FVAAIIDAFGLMGSEQVAFGWNKFAGLAVMIGGVLLFKFK
ncbi:MAG: DMT family transporter, partial [Clostridia bacterium]|nr:DMT family transporter [Clostridia bacterium]